MQFEKLYDKFGGVVIYQVRGFNVSNNTHKWLSY